VTPDEIRAIPLFAGVSDAGVERLAESAGEMTGETGQVLALQGDPGSGMFVILDGTVSVELRGGNVELGPGGTRMARVRASSPVRCIGIPRDDATALIESEPTVALAMLKEIARRFASALPDS